ncbi:MAG: prolyl oligopeptidase family serine peptidase [Candidatus Riflebacteria bacterium]|nr:prolyl oligopeptidase family serine peptidase [Candidatus Riflebacteria bacterium]
MTTKPVTASYIDWEPAVSAQDIFRATVAFSFLSADAAGQLFWVELRPEEKGRCVIMMRTLAGECRELLPSPFSARSRVMEYGGMPYVVANGRVIFANFADQRLYALDSENPGIPQPLTTEKTGNGLLMKYLQPVVSPDGRWLVAACEVEDGSSEPMNALCVVDLQVTGLQEPRIIVKGADFYKQPTFSADGSRLAWLEWNHPCMPWDSTILTAAPFANGNIDAEDTCRIAGSTTSAVNDFAFSPGGEIRFVMDIKDSSPETICNFFNLYSWRDGVVRPLTHQTHEIAAFVNAGKRVLALIYREGSPSLAWIDPVTGQLTDLQTPFSAVNKPVLLGDRIAVVGTPADRPTQLALIDPNGQVEVLREASQSDLHHEDVSAPRRVSFPTADGGVCYGYFYPPKNRRYLAPEGELPPVRVLVHGGPTGMARPGFSRENVFWTSQGYAIFDVNYRGSLGFGRAYRDALLGNWGILDINDVRDGLIYLRQQRMIGDQAVVSGGSAGGYTVQRLLTEFPDMFATGASYFGIGNLVTLQNLTHKFEARYLEGLLGGPMSTHRQVFEDRSPINHLENLKSPMIIFQGSEDKVVPPENSREMAEILARKKVLHEYYEYKEEGHGFRQKANLVDSLEKEAVFFKKILRQKNRK